MNENTGLFFFFPPHPVNAPVPPRRWLLEFFLRIFTDVFPRSVERSLEGGGKNMVLVSAIICPVCSGACASDMCVLILTYNSPKG